MAVEISQEKFEEIKFMYESGAKYADIADISQVPLYTIQKKIPDWIAKGKINKRRKTRESCTVTPGKACLNCPYSDCVATNRAPTKEETTMLRDGLYEPKTEIYFSMWW